VPGWRADHDGQLDFPVQLGRAGRDDQRVVGAGHSAGVLVEYDGLRRDGDVGFRCMVGVVEANPDQVGDTGHARSQASAGGNARKGGGVNVAQARQHRGRQHAAIDVRHDIGEIAREPLRVEHARLLAAASTES